MDKFYDWIMRPIASPFHLLCLFAGLIVGVVVG